MTKGELFEQLKLADDSEEVYVMVSLERDISERLSDRLAADWNSSHSKMHITSVSHEQFHCVLHIPKMLV